MRLLLPYPSVAKVGEIYKKKNASLTSISQINFPNSKEIDKLKGKVSV